MCKQQAVVVVVVVVVGYIADTLIFFFSLSPPPPSTLERRLPPPFILFFIFYLLFSLFLFYFLFILFLFLFPFLLHDGGRGFEGLRARTQGAVASERTAFFFFSSQSWYGTAYGTVRWVDLIYLSIYYRGARSCAKRKQPPSTHPPRNRVAGWCLRSITSTPFAKVSHLKSGQACCSPSAPGADPTTARPPTTNYCCY